MIFIGAIVVSALLDPVRGPSQGKMGSPPEAASAATGSCSVQDTTQGIVATYAAPGMTDAVCTSTLHTGLRLYHGTPAAHLPLICVVKSKGLTVTLYGDKTAAALYCFDEQSKHPTYIVTYGATPLPDAAYTPAASLPSLTCTFKEVASGSDTVVVLTANPSPYPNCDRAAQGFDGLKVYAGDDASLALVCTIKRPSLKGFVARVYDDGTDGTAVCANVATDHANVVTYADGIGPKP